MTSLFAAQTVSATKLTLMACHGLRNSVDVLPVEATAHCQFTQKMVTQLLTEQDNTR